MPARPILTPKIKNRFVHAIAITGFAILLAPGAEAYTTWTISIEATGNQQKPAKYTVSRTDTGTPCKYINANSDAPKLHVCPNDIVQWVASTASDSSGTKKNELFIFHEDLILLDGNGHSVQTLHSSDGTAIGGTIDPNASQVGHEYYVIVYDRANKKWYVEDPKIIIGGTLAQDLIEVIQEKCDQLTPLLDKNNDLGEKTRGLVRVGCKQFRDINNPGH